MNHLYLDTPRGQLRLYPHLVSDIVPSTLGTYDLVVYHGENHRSDLYLSHAEAAEFIHKMSWKPHNCRMQAGTCYGRREADTVPEKCVGCRLRKYLADAGFNDLRDPLRFVEHPFAFPLKASIALALAMWAIGSFTRYEWRQIEARAVQAEQSRDYWQARAVRAEDQVRQTFKRQATSVGKERDRQ